MAHKLGKLTLFQIISNNLFQVFCTLCAIMNSKYNKCRHFISQGKILTLMNIWNKCYCMQAVIVLGVTLMFVSSIGGLYELIKEGSHFHFWKDSTLN